MIHPAFRQVRDKELATAFSDFFIHPDRYASFSATEGMFETETGDVDTSPLTGPTELTGPLYPLVVTGAYMSAGRRQVARPTVILDRDRASENFYSIFASYAQLVGVGHYAADQLERVPGITDLEPATDSRFGPIAHWTMQTAQRRGQLLFAAHVTATTMEDGEGGRFVDGLVMPRAVAAEFLLLLREPLMSLEWNGEADGEEGPEGRVELPADARTIISDLMSSSERTRIHYH